MSSAGTAPYTADVDNPLCCNFARTGDRTALICPLCPSHPAVSIDRVKQDRVNKIWQVAGIAPIKRQQCSEVGSCKSPSLPQQLHTRVGLVPPLLLLPLQRRCAALCHRWINTEASAPAGYPFNASHQDVIVVNGGLQPKIRMVPGVPQLWRMVNAAWKVSHSAS